ncbi:hypothetical protein [Candidatus Neptunichlamydia sp. REUL1]|uniref:hypothetical protein n=1 Tax=Candidatus Neptunichlamydia sp. REUL1 TaxID=3064277 RepID=UPI00292F019F|nr:hypothetical protein [Candidatus Neptunochlamydia sp. REUL1]
MAAVTGGLTEKGLFILELSQYSAPSTGQFFMRIYFKTTIETPEEEIAKAFDTIAKQFKMSWDLHDKDFRPKILLMVSKHNHCDQETIRVRHDQTEKKLVQIGQDIEC